MKVDGANEVILTPVGNVTHGDMPISAYWCPFIQGMQMPGYVDIPKHKPDYSFMFTAAMNGCALIVTETPGRSDMIRVYHNQHPHEETVNASIRKLGKPILSRLVFEDYGRDTGTLPAPNGFNFLYYSRECWMIYSQPQMLDLVTSKVMLNRSLPSRMLEVNAGIAK